MYSKIPPHENVIRGFGVYTHCGEMCLVMEHATLGSLDNFRAAHFPAEVPPPQHIMVEWLLQVLLGLSHLHKFGVLHRDVKPPNILVCGSRAHPRLVVADFGVSREVEGDSTGLFTVVGTPGYCAPELMSQWGIAPHAEYSVSADLWSLGAIFHCLAIGKTPLIMAANPKEMVSVANGTVRPLTVAAVPGGGVDEIFCSFVRKATAHQRANRFKSCADALSHPLFSPIPTGTFARDLWLPLSTCAAPMGHSTLYASGSEQRRWQHCVFGLDEDREGYVLEQALFLCIRTRPVNPFSVPGVLQRIESYAAVTSDGSVLTWESEEPVVPESDSMLLSGHQAVATEAAAQYLRCSTAEVPASAVVGFALLIQHTAARSALSPLH